MVTLDQIEDFLKDFKQKKKLWSILFRDDRGKNAQSLADLEIRPIDRENLIDVLKISDYSEGPLKDTLYGGSEMWVFGKEMKLDKEIRTLTFRKKTFSVRYHFYLCEESNEQFTTTELDELNLNQVYNQYREEHRLPFPDEIKAIRVKYGLSAVKMAEVLGFGANIYRNYENGEVPSESNARLIQLAKDPRKFKELIEICRVFSTEEQKKLIRHVHMLIESEKENCFSIGINDYLLGSKLPDIFSGYKVPNLEKLTEMVVYFSYELEPYKTKLNKLLFYSDFLQFKKTSFSISGARYRAINMGPVPNNLNSIFEFIANNDDVDIYPTEFPGGAIGEQFKPNPKRKFNSEVFSEAKLQTLKNVAIRFDKIKTDEINISLMEKAWLKNYEAGRQLIKYDYGFELMVV